jgi:hypothetical protein
VTGRKSTSAAFAIAVLLLAQLGASLHRAEVRHVRCGHGELVHATIGAKHSTDASRLVAVESGDDGDDDHCLIATGVRCDARMSAPAIAVQHQVTKHAIVIAIPRVVVQTTLYRTAPKTSPPANA